MNLADASELARALVAAMRPYCAAVQVAGSIRRRKPEVGDLEIVAVPLWEDATDPADLFGEKTVRRNRLFQEWRESGPPPPAPRLQWIHPSAPDVRPHEIQEGGKFWKAYLPDHGIKLDLFLTTPPQWGAIFLIRTGCAEFSEGVVTHAKNTGWRFRDGRLWTPGGEIHPTPTEQSVFDALDLVYVEPSARVGKSALRRKDRHATP